MMLDQWCVRHTDGWCRLSGRPAESVSVTARTHCGLFVKPQEFAKRPPTCVSCISMLNKKAAVVR